MNSIPEQLYRAQQVREFDRRAIEEQGIPGFELMQRAAAAAFTELKQRWPQARHLHVVCGAGNNGGDGLVLAGLALAEDFEVSAELLCEPERLQGDAAKAWQFFLQAGGQPVADTSAEIAADVVVDALLGTGADRAVAGAFLFAIERMNAARRRRAGILSLDIPSGLHADTGVVLGAAVCADLTVTFIAMKLGLMTGSGPAFVGELRFSGLQVPSVVFADEAVAARIIQEDLRQTCLPPRQRDAHKNRHGHVLCVGGDYGTAGAIRLAAEAALRSGAGLVSVATRPAVAVAMSQSRPELMCRGVEEPGELDSLLAQADAVLLGPGLGQAEWGRALWSKVMDCGLPLVLDADGLNLLAWNPLQRGNWILTPHPGEAARLLDSTNQQIQADRVAAVQALAVHYDAVALLKGAGTVITETGRDIYLCEHGNPGMAVGGMGDLLGGVIVALVAQGLPLLQASCLAVDIHARAADMAVAGGERGLLPSDLLPYIRQLVNP